MIQSLLSCRSRCLVFSHRAVVTRLACASFSTQPPTGQNADQKNAIPKNRVRKPRHKSTRQIRGAFMTEKMPPRVWDVIDRVATHRSKGAILAGKPFNTLLIPRIYVAAEAQEAWPDEKLTIGGWFKLLHDLSDYLEKLRLVDQSNDVAADGVPSASPNSSDELRKQASGQRHPSMTYIGFVRWVARQPAFLLMLVAVREHLLIHPFRVLVPGPLPVLAHFIVIKPEMKTIHLPTAVRQEYRLILLGWISAYRTSIDDSRITTHLKLINSWKFNGELACALSEFIVNKQLLSLVPDDVRAIVALYDLCFEKMSACAEADPMLTDVPLELIERVNASILKIADHAVTRAFPVNVHQVQQLRTACSSQSQPEQ